MKTKFEKGEVVTLNGKEVTIKAAKKNFSTGVVSYRLTSGGLANEKDLKKSGKAGTKPTDPALLELREKYAQLYGKAVTPSHKNKMDWLQKKVDEKQAEIDFAGGGDKKDEEVTETPFEIIRKLDHEALVALVKEKELEIDPEDYDNEEDFFTAVCDELEIEIPETSE